MYQKPLGVFLKTYDEIKARYEELTKQHEELLEDVAFGANPAEAPHQLLRCKGAMEAAAELMKLRLYRPLFGNA